MSDHYSCNRCHQYYEDCQCAEKPSVAIKVPEKMNGGWGVWVVACRSGSPLEIFHLSIKDGDWAWVSDPDDAIKFCQGNAAKAVAAMIGEGAFVGKLNETA